MDRDTAVAFARGNPAHEAPTGELRQDTLKRSQPVDDAWARKSGVR